MYGDAMALGEALSLAVSHAPYLGYARRFNVFVKCVDWNNAYGIHSNTNSAGSKRLTKLELYRGERIINSLQ